MYPVSCEHPSKQLTITPFCAVDDPCVISKVTFYHVHDVVQRVVYLFLFDNNVLYVGPVKALLVDVWRPQAQLLTNVVLDPMCDDDM